MTTNITLRIPTNLAPLLDQAATDSNQSRHAFIIATLRTAVQRDDLDPHLVAGFVPLLSTEIPPDADCPECGCPLEGPHIGFTIGTTRPIPFGPICLICATTA